MSSLLKRLAEVCREHRVREKVVVVPSLAIGHQIGDALARAGTSWVNLRFETTRTIADSIAGFDLAKSGITVLSRAQALALIERACATALGAASYFEALVDAPGLHRAIQKSIDDLRHAGVGADILGQVGFEEPQKSSDLAAVMDAYERELREGRYIDRYGVIARALQLLDAGYRPPEATWLVTADVELTTAEDALIERVSGGTFERAGEDAAMPHGGRFMRAAGEENEIRGVLRTILSSRVPLDDAELIYTAREPYLALAYELLAEHGIPATFAEGIAVPYTRPGQACIGFLRWIADDFDASHLERVARAGAISFGDAFAPLTPYAFARVLRESQVGWGAQRYVARISAHAAELAERLSETDGGLRERLQRDLANANAALLAVTRMTASAAGFDPDRVDVSALAQVAGAFLEEFVTPRSDVDAMAAAGLRRMLGELEALPASPRPLRVVAEHLVEAVRGTYVGASNPRPGHLHVAPVRGGGWSGRREFFVVGLDDARHPGGGIQDPIVLDEERAAINAALGSPRLLLRGDAPLRVSADFRRFLARTAGASLTFSWAEIDLLERRGRFPARDLLEIFRSGHGESATFQDLVDAAGKSGFLEASTPLNESEWWLAQRFTEGRRDLASAVLEAYPWLASGARAEEARASAEITAWDGRIDLDPSEIDPRLTGRTYSASQVEKIASCPFGWFLERVLWIKPLERMERVADRWLDPRNVGSMVHSIFEKGMTAVRDAGERPSFAKHRALFHGIALSEIEAWRGRIPVPTEAAFERQKSEALDACDVFLRVEEKRPATLEPKYFEVGFGYPERDGEAGLGQALAIPLAGGSLLLRGRIDRVDRDTATRTWEVWDYKTGGTWGFTDSWRFRQGTKLQHAIYARAVNEMLREQGLDETVSKSGYYFPTSKGSGVMTARDCDPGQLEQVLNRIFDVIRTGYFPTGDNCRFCDFAPVCGEYAAERNARKLEANADDPAVRAWQRLQEVE